MSDKIAEKIENSIDWQNLPILTRDNNGEYIKPLTPNHINLGMRANGDALKYLDAKNRNYEKRGKPLKIEEFDLISVMTLLQKANRSIKNLGSGKPLVKEDLVDLVSYLDWSYQQQVGVTAGQSNLDEAVKHGTGATDVLMLFRSIKNRIEDK